MPSTALLAPGVAKRVTSEGGNCPIKAPVSETYYADTQPLPAYPDASTAENAFVRIVVEQWMAVIDRQLAGQPAKAFCLEAGTEVAGYFLKLT